MNRNIDMEQLRKDAADYFNGGYACSESVICAIRKNFGLDWPDDVIAMSSGFPWGLGDPGCICGALAGGTMCLGYFFGRRRPGDPKVQRCFRLTTELHDGFTAKCGAPCCGKLIAGYDRDAPERKAKCTGFVEYAVTKTAEIILRELAADETSERPEV